MWPGIEVDLIPTQPAGSEAAKHTTKRKEPRVWLAGELIVRCEHQGLQQLPPQLFIKGTLRKLILTGNALEQLPDDIQGLKELRELVLGHNRLQWLPDAVCSLQHLQQLDVQHNQLHTVPTGLCRLIHLTLMNLDGNPLNGTAGSAGSPLCALWPAAPAPGRDLTNDQDAVGQQKPPAPGREAAAATLQRLRQGTDTILQYLLKQQEPQLQMEVKQAKLKLLQQSSLQRISKLLTVADLDSLAACLDIATSTGLGEECVSQIQKAQAATNTLQQATAHVQAVRKQQAEVAPSSADESALSAAHQQLTAAIRGFEAICKPGRPSGPVYHEAHSEWRSLQRQQLERGWRCASPSSPGSTTDHGPSSSNPEHTSPMVTVETSSFSPPRRFLTSAERRRQQLQAAGAQTYDQWCTRKQETEQQERNHWQRVAEQKVQAKVSRTQERAVRALENCSREKAWPSKVVEAYPNGTFSRPPEMLKAIRRQYQRPPAVNQ